MALNFPASPSLSDTFTDGTTTWQWDGTAWNITTSSAGINVFTRFNADTGFTVADVAADALTVAGGTNVTTEIVGDTLTINSTGGGGGSQNLFSTIDADNGSVTAQTTSDTLLIAGGTNISTNIVGNTLTINASAGSQNLFATVSADEGTTTADTANDTLNILGGTNISTAIATDSDDVTINLTNFSIDFLSDVDTTSSAPTTGQVLKWNGTNWAPGADATTGGAGTDADTLDGFDSAYYLDYNNLSNTPSVVALDSFSVGVENTPSGNGAISYNDTTGEFKFTPPTAAGIGALTTETNDLTAAVVWANVPNANITESSVTQHQAALSITESQISDFGTYLTSVSASDLNSISIDALSDVDTTTAAPSTNQVLAWNGSNWTPADAGVGGGDPNQNAFSNIAVSTVPAQSTISADTTTDTVTFIPGNGIAMTTNASNDTITITSTVSSGVTNFKDTTDAINAGIGLDDIFEHAIVTLRTTAVGFTAYNFNSHYSGNNPTIYALSGTTICFDLSNAAGHPTEIQDSSGTPLSTGVFHVDDNGNVTEQVVDGVNHDPDRGHLYWRIPESFSGTYRYQCTAHAPMVGSIVVKRFSLI
jgi:plastocyanin